MREGKVVKTTIYSNNMSTCFLAQEGNDTKDFFSSRTIKKGGGRIRWED